MVELPEPEDTGSSGTQEAGIVSISEIVQESPLMGLPITRTVEGLAATKWRSMGGEVGAALIAGSFTQLSHELQETKHELSDTRGKLDEVRDKLSACKVKTAVLGERVTSLTTGRHLKNLSIAAGTVMISIGIEFYRNTFEKFAFIVGGLGVVLILFGWLSRKEEVDK